MEPSLIDALAAGERAGSAYALSPPGRAPGGFAGKLLARQSGNSIDFREHREYHPGDDVRRIDWNVFARSDNLTVRMFHDEMSPHLDLVIDASRSMSIGGTKKAEATLGVSAMLVAAAANAGFTRSVWIAGETCRRVENGNDPAPAWEGIDLGFRGTVEDSLGRTRPQWRPFGMRVLVSDLLWLGEPDATLRHLAHRAASVVVIQLLAEREQLPDRRGNLRLTDVESGAESEVLVDDLAVERYRSALRSHQENWSAAARRAGAVMVTATAEDVAATWRIDALVEQGILDRRKGN